MFRQQTGVALITVILISAIIILMVFAMTEQQVVDGRRGSNITERYQAYMFAEWAEGWAKRVLLEDAKNGAIDHKLEEWTQVVPPFEVDGGFISGSIVERNGCFNLNNLVDAGVAQPEDITRYKRLLAALELDTGLADATVDWLDTDSQLSFPDGAESDYYARLEPPYAIANRLFISSSELLAVKGYEMEIMDKLGAHVCALPKRSKINVNFASIEVLMSMAGGIDRTTAESIIQERDKPQQGLVTKNGFTNMQQMYDVPALKNLLSSQSGLQEKITQGYGLGSDYFLLQTGASYSRSDMVVYSLLERSGTTIKTLYRAQGSY
ncbi:MAG: type II secretion system minor pseudopilin GspK [Gammaproteobacteria bacterium]|nr:type II secretion system minor pseudopilin GspK [Gammaproteobacteria bacterium]